MTAHAEHTPAQSPGIDYPWIHAWASINSFEADKLEQQLSLARSEHPPATAVFKAFRARSWYLLEDLETPQTRGRLLDWAADYGMALPERVLKLWVSPEDFSARKTWLASLEAVPDLLDDP